MFDYTPLTRSAASSPAFEGGVKKRYSGSTPSKPRPSGRGVEGLTLPEGPKEVEKVFNSPEREELKRQHLLAFQDFCLDLFEEEYGEIPPEKKVDFRFVKGILICK